MNLIIIVYLRTICSILNNKSIPNKDKKLYIFLLMIFLIYYITIIYNNNLLN